MDSLRADSLGRPALRGIRNSPLEATYLAKTTRDSPADSQVAYKRFDSKGAKNDSNEYAVDYSKRALKPRAPMPDLGEGL